MKYTSGVNRVILIGTCGKNPDIKYTRGGHAVVNFPVATHRNYKGSQVTEWHRVTAWGQVAETVAADVQKGSVCYVDGSLRYNKWQDKKGSVHVSSEIVAWKLECLSHNKVGGDERFDDEKELDDPGELPPEYAISDEDTPF